MDLSITPEVVSWAYRLFLDREPENETVVEEKAETCRSTLELRRVFMRSEEFKSKNAVFATLSGHEPPITVDFSISDVELQKIFSHVQKSWTSLGLDDPYYSVLTRGKFWKKLMSKKRIDEFYESGKQEVDRLFKTLARNSIDPKSFQNCLGFRMWCRPNQSLARRRIRDSSMPMMSQKIIWKWPRNIWGVKKYQMFIIHQLTSIDDLENFPKVDLIYSVIVLAAQSSPHHSSSHCGIHEGFESGRSRLLSSADI